MPSEADPDLQRWFSRLPIVVQELAARWSLRLGTPFRHAGRPAWVAPVVDQNQRDLVLKVGWRHFEAEHEADALRLWNGEGAVRLHAQHVSLDTSALLLERCVPGAWLSTSLPERDQDGVVADLLRRLWRAPGPGHPFRPLEVMCDHWVDEFELKLARSPQGLDAGLARVGMEMFRALPTSANRKRVLVTDLHGENVLSAQREPWLVIDPKPFVGDPAYDVLQHILNCPQRLHTDPMGVAHRMAELLQLDGDRVRWWLFARCVLESLDDPSLVQVAQRIDPG